MILYLTNQLYFDRRSVSKSNNLWNKIEINDSASSIMDITNLCLFGSTSLYVLAYKSQARTHIHMDLQAYKNNQINFRTDVLQIRISV